ncbi:MAG: hypothetical protein HYZ48_01250 [Chlamydiales bacterium]|nr:hypothetical protein [Chlamydiales bacterium]
MIRLGLILIGVISLCSLNAKEIFNAPFRCCSGELEFGAVKSVTFYYLGNEYIDIDRIVKSISKEKASVILTGEKGVDGRTLSSNMFIDVMLRRNVKEKAYLVVIDAYVKGDAQTHFRCFTLMRELQNCFARENRLF